MKNRIRLGFLLFATIFIAGCSGPSPEDGNRIASGTSLMAYPGFLLLMFLLMPLLSRLTKTKRIIHDKIYFIQFIILLLLGLPLAYLGVNWANTLITIPTQHLHTGFQQWVGAQLFSVLTIPFIIWITYLILAISPWKRICSLLPGIAGFTYLFLCYYSILFADSIGVEFPYLNPMSFPIVSFYLTIPSLLFFIIYIRIKKV